MVVGSVAVAEGEALVDGVVHHQKEIVVVFRIVVDMAVQREGVEHGEDHGEHRHEAGGPDAVPQLFGVVDAVPEFHQTVGAEFMRPGQRAGRIVVGGRLERVEQQHDEREQHDQAAHDEQDEDHPVACGAVFLDMHGDIGCGSHNPYSSSSFATFS